MNVRSIAIKPGILIWNSHVQMSHNLTNITEGEIFQIMTISLVYTTITASVISIASFNTKSLTLFHSFIRGFESELVSSCAGN